MNPVFPHRRNPRLLGYDYSSEGLYFVTICTDRRLSLFGEIVNGSMNLNADGKIVDATWSEMFRFSEGVDTWVVMPNHIHGIIAIGDVGNGHSRIVTTGKPLGRLIAGFKTVSTKRIKVIGGFAGVGIWQRNFYEHIIGTDRASDRIVAYIQDNPARWEHDPENPTAIKPDRNI
jgi:putative transposase